MRVVVFSCDKYSWLVPIFLHFYKKNWPDNPYQTMIVTEAIKADDMDTFCAGEIAWTDRAIKCLESFNDEKFILFLEEYILNEKVNNDEIKKAAELCADDIGCVRLYPYGRLSYLLVDIRIKGFKEYLLDKPYAFTHQASIWQKGFFLDILKQGESNWQSEIEGSKRICKLGKRVIWSDAPVLNYHRCGYMRKGRVVKSEEKWVKENW